MVVVPGTEGDFGVLAGHAPYMSTLRNGDIAIYPRSMADTPERIPVEGGFAEVNERASPCWPSARRPMRKARPAPPHRARRRRSAKPDRRSAGPNCRIKRGAFAAQLGNCQSFRPIHQPEP